MSDETITNTMTEEQLIEEMPETHKKETESALAYAQRLVKKADAIALYELYKESVRKRLDLLRVLHTVLQDFGPGAKPTVMRQSEQPAQSDAAMVKALADRVVDLAQMVLEQNKNRS